MAEWRSGGLIGSSGTKAVALESIECFERAHSRGLSQRCKALAKGLAWPGRRPLRPQNSRRVRRVYQMTTRLSSGRTIASPALQP